MSLQAMFPDTGSANTVASVQRCRLFMGLSSECLHQAQAPIKCRNQKLGSNRRHLPGKATDPTRTVGNRSDAAYSGM